MTSAKMWINEWQNRIHIDVPYRGDWYKVSEELSRLDSARWKQLTSIECPDCGVSMDESGSMCRDCKDKRAAEWKD